MNIKQSEIPFSYTSSAKFKEAQKEDHIFIIHELL